MCSKFILKNSSVAGHSFIRLNVRYYYCGSPAVVKFDEVYEIVIECNILEISGFLCRIFPSRVNSTTLTFNYNETREERELDPILSSCVENFREFSLVTFSVPPSLSLGDIGCALFVMC